MRAGYLYQRREVSAFDLKTTFCCPKDGPVDLTANIAIETEEIEDLMNA